MSIAGTVVYKDIEGGFYAIETEDGGKYRPTDLPEEYRVDGTRVRVIARTQPESMGIQMYGTVIEIIEIYTAL